MARYWSDSMLVALRVPSGNWSQTEAPGVPTSGKMPPDWFSHRADQRLDGGQAMRQLRPGMRGAGGEAEGWTDAEDRWQSGARAAITCESSQPHGRGPRFRCSASVDDPSSGALASA